MILDHTNDYGGMFPCRVYDANDVEIKNAIWIASEFGLVESAVTNDRGTIQVNAERCDFQRKLAFYQTPLKFKRNGVELR